jgi:ABC-type transporter Mla subunit MlaD
MMGTALGIGSSQFGQPNPWGVSPYGHAIGPQLFTQPPYSQPLQSTSVYGAGNNPYGAQTAQYAQPLQQIQQLLHILPQQVQQLQQLQQHQHILQQQQLHLLQQLLQLVPQQLQQLQQLVQLLPQQLQQIQQLVQFVPQQIHQLQQQLQALQTPFGTAAQGVPGFGISQPFGASFAWPGTAQGISPLTGALPFGVPTATGQVM